MLLAQLRRVCHRAAQMRAHGADGGFFVTSKNGIDDFLVTIKDMTNLSIVMRLHLAHAIEATGSGIHELMQMLGHAHDDPVPVCRPDEPLRHKDRLIGLQLRLFAADPIMTSPCAPWQ